MRTWESVRISLDKDLKHLFEATTLLHSTTYTQLLETAIRDLLLTLNDTTLIDKEITRKELEIIKLHTDKQQLISLKQKITDIHNIPTLKPDTDELKQWFKSKIEMELKQ